MKVLKDILYKVPLVATSGDTNITVHQIQFDSRLIEDGDLFIAVHGTQVDGHTYIDKALEKGAVAIVCEKLPKTLRDEVTYVQVKDSARALGIIASNFYGNPSEKLKIVAVTGTNGKTTTATLLFEIFGKLGYSRGLLSTVANKIDDEVIKASHTTPDSLQLNRLMSEMVHQGCTHCFMEASSHAIHQDRISGIDIDLAIFTNITHDHLDYHHTFDAYIEAKKKLFDNLKKTSFALVNIDDKRGKVMLQNTSASKKTYGLKNMADFKGKVLSNTLQGLEIEINQVNTWFPLTGNFNAYNILAVYGAAILLEEDPVEVLTALSGVHRVPGRFELVAPETGVYAIVDYAHTPNALENVLETLKELRTGNEQVITVFGCGGDRDKEKRPIMAEIACRFSDRVIVTSDNPRSEEPADIIRDIMAGVKPQFFRKTMTVADRKEAIKIACNMANEHDIILVAGKGHENYQEIKGKRYDFDDREILRDLLKMKI